MVWGRGVSRSIAGASIVAALPWSLIWQGLGGQPWPRCSVAPGNLSDIGKPNSYGWVPHCMEFDSGGNGVRETTRTGLPWYFRQWALELADLAMVIGIASSFRARLDTRCVTSVTNQKRSETNMKFFGHQLWVFCILFSKWDIKSENRAHLVTHFTDIVSIGLAYQDRETEVLFTPKAHEWLIYLDGSSFENILRHQQNFC